MTEADEFDGKKKDRKNEDVTCDQEVVKSQLKNWCV